jgi:hypothetical protein
MSTYRPELTAEQIIEGCAQEELTVSKQQLGRWARKDRGLLPPPRRRGKRGEGRGVTWVWDVECLPRAIIIARTLQQGDPSLKQAAMELWIRGYVPTAPTLLRELLHHVVAGFEERIQRRQTYLKQTELSIYERRRRFSRAKKRKLAAAPQELREFGVLTGQGLVGLANPSRDSLSAVTSSISFKRLHAIVDASTDADIMRAASQALRFLRTVDGWLTPLLQTAFERGRSHREDVRQGGGETPAQDDIVSEWDCLWFAPLTTLGIIALRHVSIRHLKATMSLLREVAREILGSEETMLMRGVRESALSGELDDIVTFVEPSDGL